MGDAPQTLAATPSGTAERTRYSPLLWLNLFCLDAPIVAITWQWLFAHTFGARIDFALRGLLFLTAWLIYLGDRFADTITLPAGAPMSLRHRFCKEHMIGWWVAVVVIFLADSWVALQTLDLQMLLLGGTLAILCGVYLFVNHSLGGRWGPLPIKEKSIGLLFAAGTTLGVIGELPGVTISFGVAVILFAVLCTFNCLSIASWERDLDDAQGKTSFLLYWPAFTRYFRWIALGFVGAALVLSFWWRFAVSLWFCLGLSALLLLWLSRTSTLRRDERTALADLVLLTPLAPLLLSFR